MLNSKIINIGAFILFAYCLYESKPLDNIGLGYEIKDGSTPKYSFKIDIDENNHNRTLVDKSISYLLSSRIEKAKALSVEKQNVRHKQDESRYVVAESDKISFSYVLHNIDESKEEGFLDNFVIGTDLISDSLKGMQMLGEKKIQIIPNSNLPSFLDKKNNLQDITITIKSLTKAPL